MKFSIARRVLVFAISAPFFANLAGATSRAADNTPAQPVTWDLAALTANPPAVTPVATTETGVKALYYAGLPFHGHPTESFAYYGAPAGAPPAGGWPGVVLLHGGGGTADADWVRKWNAAGFAAIAMDLEGHEPDPDKPKERRPNPAPGPAQAGVFGDSGAPVEDQFPYHAVAEAILANSLIRSYPEVNPSKVGLCGISWGSIWTCIAAGVDHRFAFAIPIYGHGFLYQSSGQVNIPTQSAMRWDPSLYLASAKQPFLFVASTNDRFFSFEPWQKSVNLIAGNAQALLVPHLAHSQEDGDSVPEPYIFARRVVDGQPPFEVTRNSAALTSPAQVSADPAGAKFWYTDDSGPSVNRGWKSLDAVVAGNVVSAPKMDDPAGITASYFLVTLPDGERRSSPVNFDPAADVVAPPPSVPTGAAARVLFSENFDALTPGPLDGQNGWKAGGVAATVEPADGHGNIVTLAPKYSQMTCKLPQPVTSDTVFVLFSVKATPPGPAGPMASEMLLIYLQDAGGKVLALAWHAGSGQWGIQSNGNYLNNFLPSYVADWTQVELILDQKRRKATEILTNGAKQTVLYNAVNFTDQDAGQLASIQLVRNKDGNDQNIAIDDISVVVPASQP